MTNKETEDGSDVYEFRLINVNNAEVSLLD